MNRKYITRAELSSLVAELIRTGTSVIAPVVEPGPSAGASTGASSGFSRRVDYRVVSDPDDVSLGPELPRRSLKEFLFPPTEVLLRWSQHGSEVALEETSTLFEPRVFLGAKPCDAAALDILDRVMDWGYRDELWFGRRESTTVFAMACPGVDGSCFCTALGLGPDATRGADLFMTPAEKGFVVDIVTSRGQSFAGAHAGRFQDRPEAEPGPDDYRAAHKRVAVGAPLALERVPRWLSANFEHRLWEDIALRCHGCGICASVCPTCHCFDIVDEPDGLSRGARRRNWDTCQTARFTVHASGHNPRAHQNVRYRQRVMHKFSIYPERFREVLCTGCGRCSRACPGGMDLFEVLERIAGLAGQDTGGAR